LMTFLKIGLGVGIGQRMASLLPGGGSANIDPVALPEWTLWMSLALTPWALTVLFRARWKEAPWVFLGSVVAFWGARLGVELLGSGLGAVIGALVTGLAANLYARRKRRPAVVLVVPSLILLVPGSIGYRSLSLLMAEDVTSGISNAFEALLVGVSLVAGLLLSNVLLPPRKAL